MYPQKGSSSATLKQQLDLVVSICRVNSIKKTRLVLIFSCVNIFADQLCLQRCWHVIHWNLCFIDFIKHAA